MESLKYTDTELWVRYYDKSDTIAIYDPDWKIELKVPYNTIQKVMKQASILRKSNGLEEKDEWI